MKKIFLLVVSSLVLLFFSFCGKKGPIQAPLVKFPQKIENLNAVQRGDKVILVWANPTTYSDGSPITGTFEVELWLVEEEKPVEQKPTEEKSVEQKPGEQKAAEEKPEEKKPSEEKAPEQKPTEVKPPEEKPPEQKPAEVKKPEEKPLEQKPAEEKATQEKPVEEKQAAEKTGEQKPAETKPYEMSLLDFKSKAKLEITLKQEVSPLNEKGKKEQGESKENASEKQYIYKINGENIVTKILTFAVRVKDGKKYSDYSKLVSIIPQIIPWPPQNVSLKLFEDRVEVQWEPPKQSIDQSTPPKVGGYNIYRAEGKEPPKMLNSILIKETKFDDREFLFEKQYKYFVRASATETSPYLESEDSEAKEILPKDTFPPAAPSNLMIISGDTYISLSWEANREKDFAGYKVWRKGEGEADFVLLTPDLVTETSFKDSAVEKNKRYYYAIATVDRNGNESQKSESVSEIIKDKF